MQMERWLGILNICIGCCERGTLFHCYSTSLIKFYFLQQILCIIYYFWLLSESHMKNGIFWVIFSILNRAFQDRDVGELKNYGKWNNARWKIKIKLITLILVYINIMVCAFFRLIAKTLKLYELICNKRW